MSIHGAVQAAEISRAKFGALPDGRPVEAITLRNAQGVSATIITYGATLQSVILPDRAGKSADVALGYKTLDGYLKKPEYFGTTVGRFANRIAKGRFTLDGKSYQTPVNNNGNSLHGGERGFDKVLWEVVDAKGGAARERDAALRESRRRSGLSRHADCERDVRAQRFRRAHDRVHGDDGSADDLQHHEPRLLESGRGGRACRRDEASTDDRGTAVHARRRDADPDRGAAQLSAGTVFDFRQPTAIGARVREASDAQIRYGRGYDHNFVIARDVAREPRFMARVEDPDSGRSFELWSNQPGLQFYSGNFLDGTVVGKSGRIYRQGDALVLEPQLFPDTPNQPSLGSARLAPGETYRNTIIYRFKTARAQG